MKKQHCIALVFICCILTAAVTASAVKTQTEKQFENRTQEITQAEEKNVPKEVEKTEQKELPPKQLSLGDALLTVKNYARVNIEYCDTIDSAKYESQNYTHYLITVVVDCNEGGGWVDLYKISKSTGEITFIAGMQQVWYVFEEDFGEFMNPSLHNYQLIEYAKVYLTDLYQKDEYVNINYTGSNVGYLLSDLTNDGMDELIICGTQDGNMITYFEVYENDSGYVYQTGSYSDECNNFQNYFLNRGMTMDDLYSIDQLQ